MGTAPLDPVEVGNIEESGAQFRDEPDRFCRRKMPPVKRHVTFTIAAFPMNDDAMPQIHCQNEIHE
jgi:hypothetical protein